MFFQAFVLAFLTATAVAAPFRSRSVLHEKRSGLIKVRRGERIGGEAILPVRIGLKQRNLENGYAHLMDVSHPSSPNWGKHWTKDEVNSMFAPTDDTIESVKAWLVASGISESDIVATPDKGWLGMNIPAWKVEELFDTEYYEHESPDGTVRLGCDRYHLPEHVSAHVDYIKPGVALSPPIKKRTVKRHVSTMPTRRPSIPSKRNARPPYPFTKRQSNTTGLENCGSAITPACIRALYDIPTASASDDQNALGIYENQSDIYSQDDLNLFFAKYAPQVPQGTHPTLVDIDGAPQPGGNAGTVGGESNLDLDLAYSLIYPQSVVLYQVEEEAPTSGTDDQINNEYTGFITFLDAVDGSFCTSIDQSTGLQCGGASLTRVVSISYGSSELQYTEAASDRSCQEFMKLSLQGVTFVVSSGDYGVAHSPQSADSNACVDRNNVTNIYATNGDVFAPSFPATCPYVLAVGATQLTANETVDDPESVMNIPRSILPTVIGSDEVTFSSSGGFSNFNPRPDYQSTAVSDYLSNSVPDYPSYSYSDSSSISGSDGVYNRDGRALPDVSANGAYLQFFVQGQEGPTYGTSLAAPIWASMLTLVNEERTKQGKGPVGFVNAVLYENTDIFNDITSGSNPGCGTDGFPAVAGWDPSTGLGTPNYPKLLSVLSSL